MQRRTPRRPLTRYVAIALILLLMPVFVLAGTVAATGVVTVSVHETGADGVRLYIPVPALLLDAAVFVAPLAMPEDALADVRQEIAPYLPALEQMADELADCPSGVLVDVRTGDEHIRVTKTWRSFEVEVDSPEADISVSVPARLLGRSLDLLG